MGFWFDSFMIELVISILVGLILYLQYAFRYWKHKGIIQKKPSMPFGNVSDVVIRKKSLGKWSQDMYNYFNKFNAPYGGLYLSYRPELIILDPNLIHAILSIDFEYFTDRGTYNNEQVNPTTYNLFMLEGGPKWKNLRKKIVSVFTINKMKMMFPLIVECSKELQNYVYNKTVQSEPVDIKHILARFTMDNICSCVFGIDADNMKDPHSEFVQNANKTINMKLIDALKFSFSYINHEFFKTFKISVTNKEVENFFINFVNDTVKYREENNIVRLDLMQLFIELKNEGQLLDDNNLTNNIDIENGSVKLTMNEIVAQCYLFFFAGFETSATLMTFLLYEASIHLDIQDKLQEEIQSVLKKHNNELTYDALMEMTYLDKVVHETLRKYPSLPYITRRSVKDYNIPDTDIILEKGTYTRISILGIHHDPKYYPNPEIFDPERFSKEEKAKRTPYTYLPFGIGPRTCVAYRFGILQSKIGVCSLLQHFRFTLNGEIKPLEENSITFALGTKHPILLNAKMVSNFN